MTDTAVREPFFEVAAPEQALRVAWLGPGIEEMKDVIDADLFSASSIGDVASRDPDVLHITLRGANLRALRRAVPRAALVLDLSSEEWPLLDHREARRARVADRILVASHAALREFSRQHPELAERACVAPKPLDLERHSPLRLLATLPGMDSKIKRFRRVHRLTEPMILFVGPYTPEGRLDATLECVYALRERFPELRLAAIPTGKTDRRYLDRCERRALGLGHHGVIEWIASPEEIPIWYSLATVVLVPHARGASASPAAFAAAAGRPFVGTLGGSADEVVVDGETGFLVPAADPATLQAAVEALVGDQEEATRLGAAARERAEQELGAASAARYVQRAWTDATRRAPGRLDEPNGNGR